MKIRLLIIFSLLLQLVACKTNNGDIGRYYGTWALDQIWVDGALDTSWQEPGTWTSWSFQNNIVEIARFDDLQDKEACYGTWRETSDPDMLVLDFTHRDDATPEGTGVYAAPAWILLEPGVNSLRIDHATDKVMTLSYIDSQGRKIRYDLRKTY